MHKKTLAIIFTLLVFVSCGGSGGGGSSDGSLSSISSVQETGPVPAAADTFNVNTQMTGFDVEQEQKVLDASELIKMVVASQEFKDSVINFKYKGKKQFVDNGGLTNTQVYQRILTGAEIVAGGGDNNAMDLQLELYNDGSNVVGYTLPSVVKIWMNTKYFNSFKPYQVAGNMMHEWLHKLGFKHDYNSTPSRPYSVPYAIGYIARDLAKKFYNQAQGQ